MNGVFNSPCLDAQRGPELRRDHHSSILQQQPVVLCKLPQLRHSKAAPLDPEKVEAAMEFVNWMVHNTTTGHQFLPSSVNETEKC